MFDAEKKYCAIDRSTRTSYFTPQIQKTFTSTCIWEINIISVTWLHINCLHIFITQLTRYVNLIMTCIWTDLKDIIAYNCGLVRRFTTFSRGTYDDNEDHCLLKKKHVEEKDYWPLNVLSAPQSLPQQKENNKQTKTKKRNNNKTRNLQPKTQNTQNYARCTRMHHTYIPVN